MAILTPKFRVSFPNVFRAKKNELNGKDEYSLVALFPKEADLTKLQEAVKKAIVDKWGADKTKWPANIRTPFRDQAERAKNVEGKQILPQGHEAGAYFMNLKSAQKPGLVNEKVEDIIDEGEFYAGCWARATVNAYAYDQKGNRGVSFGLGNIQKVGEGEPFGRKSRPEDDFAPVETTKDEKTVASSADLFN